MVRKLRGSGWQPSLPTCAAADRLAERVRVVIGQDPLSSSLFIFRSRRGDRLKILLWDRDRFVLWYKRLEAGVFKLPRATAGARSVELRASELAMIRNCRSCKRKPLVLY
jgi:transposase